MNIRVILKFLYIKVDLFLCNIIFKKYVLVIYLSLKTEFFYRSPLSVKYQDSLISPKRENLLLHSLFS